MLAASPSTFQRGVGDLSQPLSSQDQKSFSIPGARSVSQVVSSVAEHRLTVELLAETARLCH